MRRDLIPYAVTWDGGSTTPLHAPFPDGHWTPFHLAVQLPRQRPISQPPGPGDLDDQGRCWFGSILSEGRWNLEEWASATRDGGFYSHWQPWWAIERPGRRAELTGQALAATRPDSSIVPELVALLEQCPVTSDTDWIARRMELLYRLRSLLKGYQMPPLFPG